ncbi:hypothetical protein [Enterobacter sp. ECC-019]|uniref:hypothetical protein n=1 Tax=Enterobacter sp. ECC-019 TaxID=3116478 RepID=UPI00375450EB
MLRVIWLDIVSENKTGYLGVQNMFDFDVKAKQAEELLHQRGLENSSLVFNELARIYSPFYQSASPEERLLLLDLLKRYEARKGLGKPFDWVNSLK